MSEPWKNPEWDKFRQHGGGYVHLWRRYISEEVGNMWDTFTDVQKAALYRQAKEQADAEEWHET